MKKNVSPQRHKGHKEEKHEEILFLPSLCPLCLCGESSSRIPRAAVLWLEEQRQVPVHLQKPFARQFDAVRLDFEQALVRHLPEAVGELVEDVRAELPAKI